MPRNSRRLYALLISLALFGVNAWVCHKLFRTEFTNFESNAAAFISIGRFFRDHWRDARWFPWFDGGMPIENAYQPVLPALTAAISGFTHLSIGRSFHTLLSFAYCLGPVTLFWFAWEWSGSLQTGVLAGLTYSLTSPAAMALPGMHASSAGTQTALRFYNLVHYGEGPHILALTLLPLAFLSLRRVILRPSPWHLAAAVASCGTVVLTNAFGAMSLAIGATCIVIALRRGVAVTAVTGAAAWLWISPWLPLALIETIRRNAWTERGFYNTGFRTWLATGLLLVVFILAIVVAGRLKSSFERFVCLFTPWMAAFPLAAFGAGITLVPQSSRYQLEMEMALGLAIACIGFRALHWRVSLRPALLGILLAGCIYQARAYRKSADQVIHRVGAGSTVEYKVAAWIDHNLPGRRVMVSGDAAWIFNVFSENPQLSAGHEPSAPNFIQQIAVFQIYTGTNAGPRDADVSIVWLKAFGAQAITVPGAHTRESYKPFVNPDKFEGVLPVLWRGDGDTIYAVPQRSHSLVHVIPREAAVSRPPRHGLDIDPLRNYLAALEDRALPEASVNWDGVSNATIRADVKKGQVLSVQETWNPGWRAEAGGYERLVGKDGLGLMIVDPRCDGDCIVKLSYGATPEIWFCRAASALVTVMLLGYIVLSKYTDLSGRLKGADRRRG